MKKISKKAKKFAEDLKNFFKNETIPLLGIEHIEKLLKEEENAMKQVVDIIIVRILNRKEHIHKKGQERPVLFL